MAARNPRIRAAGWIRVVATRTVKSDADARRRALEAVTLSGGLR